MTPVLVLLFGETALVLLATALWPLLQLIKRENIAWRQRTKK